MQLRYSRTDARGGYLSRPEQADVEHSRLGMFWRPLIDGQDSPLGAKRIRAIPIVAGWLADPEPDRWAWFSLIGVPGLRSQVLRHAGLEHYNCRTPSDLPTPLRTPLWEDLVQAVDRFTELDDCLKSMVVFELAQLSFADVAVKLTGMVEPNGDPTHDRYAYEAMRVVARFPRLALSTLPTFALLAKQASSPILRLAGCFQGIGHCLMDADDTVGAREFEELGRQIEPSVPDSWHGELMRSRYHRALMMLRRRENDVTEMYRELEIAEQCDAALDRWAVSAGDMMVATENTRHLMEARILAGITTRDPELPGLLELFGSLDPYCVEVRLLVGDGYALTGDYLNAAPWYSQAGELCTGAGALGWFRAGQCYEALGDRGSAINAMGRCLELDTTAREPREYLDRFAGQHAVASLTSG